MALPLIGLYVLLAIIGTLFLIGISRYNVNASLGFVVFASVLMLTTSMFLINEGVQLDNVESINPDTLTYTYQTVAYDETTWNWVTVLGNVLLYGGFVAMIFGFAYNFKRSKSRQVDEWAI